MEQTKPTPKILLVEDDTLLTNLLKERLLEEGAHVEICSDGRDALKKIEETAPNLVVLGLILPTLSGIEVLARMRRNARTKNISVVILSQLHRKEDVRQVEAFGACDYFVKTDHTLEEMVDLIIKKIDCKPFSARTEPVSV